jgi:hypothetical protein
MPIMTLSINIGTMSELNTSAQIGDTVYFCNTTTTGGMNINNSPTIELGVITDFGYNYVKVQVLGNVVTPVPGAFLFFSKDNAVNMSSPIGYYAKAKFVNDSKIKSEMFATACGMFESSK